MPLPLLGIAGGVMAGVGALGHLFGAGRLNYDRSELDYDPQNHALAQYRKMTDPSYGIGQFQRLAEQTALKRSDLLNTAALSGGAPGAAIAQADASRGRARDQAFGAFGDFRLGADRAAQGYLGMYEEKEKYVLDTQATAKGYNAQRSSSFVNNLIGGGLGMAARGFSPPAAPFNPETAQAASTAAQTAATAAATARGLGIGEPNPQITPYQYRSPSTGMFPGLPGPVQQIGQDGYGMGSSGFYTGPYDGLGYGVDHGALPDYILTNYRFGG